MTDQTTGASERHEDRSANGTPVQRPVRPLVERLEAAAHAWENSLTVCGDHMPSPAMLREAQAEIERLTKERDDYERRWLAERRAVDATISGGRYPDGTAS